MKRGFVGFFSILAIATGLVSCSTPSIRQVDCSPAATVTRAETLAIAEAYRIHPWTPHPENVRHGEDRLGIRVDTPDIHFQPGNGIRPGWWVPGQRNIGMPYQWGGFDTPQEFDAKVAAGFAAGDVYTPEKRTGLDSVVSTEACGIDCSGFISRCWRLPRSYSTREIPSLCTPLDDVLLMEPGDILNKTNEHVLLFAGWVDAAKSRYYAYETGSPPTWKVLYHPIPVAYTMELGYQPFRYRGIK